MALPYHPRFALLRLRRVQAAEVPLDRPDRRAWVYVLPRATEPYPETNAGDRFHVRYTEYDRARLDALRHLERRHGLDVDMDDALVREERHEVAGEDALERLLTGWLSDLERLGPPFRCDLP